jgi:hypothetical protein
LVIQGGPHCGRNGQFFDLAARLENVSLKDEARLGCMEPLDRNGHSPDAGGLCEGSRQTDHAPGPGEPPSP